jgi:DNA-binding MarR family transcriptional regulator
VATLEAAKLVVREPDPEDGRIVRVRATARGTRLLQAGRSRRVAALAESLRALSASDRAALARAIPTLEHIARGP